MTHSAADRLDILELLASADNAATRRDVTGYMACFTDDAVLDGGMGEHRGKAAMERAVGPIWQAEGDTSVHLTTNAVVEPDSGPDDRAVAHSVLVILANDPVTVHSVSNISHHLVKESTGWRVARRRVQPPAGELSVSGIAAAGRSATRPPPMNKKAIPLQRTFWHIHPQRSQICRNHHPRMALPTSVTIIECWWTM